MAIFKVLFLALFSVLLGASFLNLLPLQSWLLELNQNFGSYYLVIHCALIPFGILLVVYLDREEEIWTVAAVNLLMAFYYAFPVVPLMMPVKVPEGDISCDRLYSTLFLQTNSAAELEEAALTIDQRKPDILFLTAESSAQPGIESIISKFKVARRTKGAGGSDLVIAAQVPLSEPKITDLGEDLPGALIVGVVGERVPHAALALIAGVNPLTDQQLAKNMLIMRRSSAALRSLAEPALAATTIRMTPHSRLYRVFKEDDVFSDLFTGKGLVRTWSGRSPLIRFHYDQFFSHGAVLSPGASTIRSEVFDHLPISADVRFCR